MPLAKTSYNSSIAAESPLRILSTSTAQSGPGKGAGLAFIRSRILFDIHSLRFS